MDRTSAVNLTDKQSRSLSRTSECNNLAKHLESTATDAVAYAAGPDPGATVGEWDTTNADPAGAARGGLALVATERAVAADLS